MDKVKELLSLECSYQLDDDIMDEFLASLDELHIAKGESIITAGSVNPDLYVVKEGIFAYKYFNGADERCWGFAEPCVLMYSYHSYYCGLPAFYQVEACCDSVVLHCPRHVFNEFIDKYHNFAKWANSMANNKLYYIEMKNSLINGNAKDRFNSMVKNRPEIMENVPMKTIAAYLGITPQYLSYIKNEQSRIDKLG